MTIRERINKDSELLGFKNTVDAIEDLDQDIIIQIEYTDLRVPKVDYVRLDDEEPFNPEDENGYNGYHLNYLAAFGSGNNTLTLANVCRDQWEVFNFVQWDRGLRRYAALCLDGPLDFEDLGLLDIWHIAIFDFIHDVEDWIKDNGSLEGTYGPLMDEPIWEVIKERWFTMMNVGHLPEDWQHEQYSRVYNYLYENPEVLDKILQDEGLL